MGSIEDIQEQTDREFVAFLESRIEALKAPLALEALLNELEHHSKKWGEEHDGKHTPEDWITILTVYMGKASYETPLYHGAGGNPEKFRKRLIQVAAIAISAWMATAPAASPTSTE